MATPAKAKTTATRSSDKAARPANVRLLKGGKTDANPNEAMTEHISNIWIAVKNIKQWGRAIIAGMLIIAGGIIWTDARTDTKIAASEARLTAKIEALDQRMSARMDRIDDRMDRLEDRMGRQDAKLDQILLILAQRNNSGGQPPAPQPSPSPQPQPQPQPS